MRVVPRRVAGPVLLVVTTAVVCFAISATTGFAAKSGRIFDVRSGEYAEFIGFDWYCINGYGGKPSMILCETTSNDAWPRLMVTKRTVELISAGPGFRSVVFRRDPGKRPQLTPSAVATSGVYRHYAVVYTNPGGGYQVPGYESDLDPGTLALVTIVFQRLESDRGVWYLKFKAEDGKPVKFWREQEGNAGDLERFGRDPVGT